MNNLVDCFVEYVKSNYHKWDTVGRWRYFGDDCQDRKDVINSIMQDYHTNNLPTEIADKLKLDDGGQANGISAFKIKDLFFIRCYGGDDLSDTLSNFEVKFQVGFGNILPAVKKQFGIDPRALPDHEDKINDKQLLTNYIDFNNRTYATVYIGNGEFIVGSPNDSHTQMLNKYTNNSLSEEWGRTSVDEVKDKCEVDSVAFCHVINDCLFIMGAKDPHLSGALA